MPRSEIRPYDPTTTPAQIKAYAGPACTGCRQSHFFQSSGHKPTGSRSKRRLPDWQRLPS